MATSSYVTIIYESESSKLPLVKMDIQTPGHLGFGALTLFVAIPSNCPGTEIVPLPFSVDYLVHGYVVSLDARFSM